MAIQKLNNFYNSWEEITAKVNEIIDSGGGGGGDVSKEYVDAQDQRLQEQINTIDNELDNKANKATTYTKTETDSLITNKLDKRTTGVEVYSHNDSTQGGLTVKTTMSGTATDTNILTEKAVKTYVDDKDPLAWNYVGILSASNGSVLNVKDDWTELLIVMRIREGSSTYNLTNVLPKRGFTEGNPTGNQTFAGFYWNDSYKATARLGLEGTGDSRNLKLNYSQATGWSISGFYVLKR